MGAKVWRKTMADDPITYCADCGQPTDGQCLHCARRVCLSCAEKGDRGLPGGHHCPGLDG